MLRAIAACVSLFAVPMTAQTPDRALHLRDAVRAKCGWGTAHDDTSVDGQELAVGEVVASASSQSPHPG